MVLLVSCDKGDKLPDMRETYHYEDDTPFGTKTAFWMMQSLYYNDAMEFLNVPLSSYYNLQDDDRSLYFSVTKRFSISEEDAEMLMQFLHRGNTVFISSNQIDSNLLKRVNIREVFLKNASYFSPMSDQFVKLDSLKNKKQGKYGYYYYPFPSFFVPDEDEFPKIIGRLDNNNQPNLVVVKINTGTLILHSSPAAFSNYFLLTGNNYEYLNRIVSMLPERFHKIYWDNYYTKNFGNKGDGFSTLAEIRKYPPLFKAFLLSALLLLIYVLFFGKRRQRTIPVIRPLSNSSVKFAEAIAGVYRRENDNKDIAKKQITYFNENLRNRFFIQTNTITDDFVETISKKSGYPLENTKKLFNTIKKVSLSDSISDNELLELNHELQKFPKLK